MSQPIAARADKYPRHRPDIDGMRAIAVTAVVLFHANVFPFRSGFVGVDIFFVLSGYLIGGIVLRSAMQGEFSFAQFYARRARRILPALFFVLFAICAIGWFVLSASEYRAVGATSTSALLATSNFSFWRHQDYFDSDSRLSPLLMTWSLGVEEQFYLIFPLLILALVRIYPKWIIHILGAFTVASFVFSLWGTRTFPIMAFYLLPSRAWELGAGATLVAWEIIHKRSEIRTWANGRAQDFLGPAGLALLAMAVFGFDASTPFPGYLALLPVIGTVALLASEESAVNRHLLSAKPMVFVGVISYSWYLWHWPLMSYAHIIAVGDPSPRLMLGVAGLAFCAAIFSWRLVERPFRKSTLPPSRLLPRYAFALAIAVVATSAIKLGQGFPQRLPLQTAIVESTITAGRGDCLAIWNQRAPDTSAACVTQRAGRPGIALIGDSHAAALGPGLRQLASKDNWGVSIFAKSSCGPLLGVSIPHDKMPFFADACSAFMTEAFNGAAKAADIKVVILAGEWAAYQRLGAAALNEGLERPIALLQQAGKQVVIAGDVPEWKIDPARLELAKSIPLRLYLARLLWQDRANRFPAQGSAKLVDPSGPEANQDLANIARTHAATWLDPWNQFCSSDGCLFEHAGDLLYLDHAHLSIFGSSFALDKLFLDGGANARVAP